MEKLNLGCGYNKMEGYLNVDGDDLVQPDQVADLESFPWPWADNSFSEISMVHVLEHLGDTSADFLKIMSELWRISKPGGKIRIAVPHHRSDTAVGDPTHKRLITPSILGMFDQVRNWQDIQAHGRESKLGLRMAIDLEVENLGYLFYEPWQSGLRSGEVSREQAERDSRVLNNVILDTNAELKAHKPCRVRSADQPLKI